MSTASICCHLENGDFMGMFMCYVYVLGSLRRQKRLCVCFGKFKKTKKVMCMFWEV